MGKILVIAEKPSVARDYARVLGCRVKKDGYIEGENYIVTWALGHLISLAEPKHYEKRFKRWKYEDLPIKPEQMKLRVIRKTAKQFKTVKELMNNKQIEYIICGTDSGREGELIFRYIYIHSKCKKPFYRLWISSMTDTAIKEGFHNMKEGKEYDNLYFSAKCRSEADWLVGINASRAFTIKHNVLLSIGRVQTPILGIIVKRQYEIDQFKPKDYYEINAEFDTFPGIWYKYEEDKKNTRIFDINKAEEIKQKVMDQTGKIINIKKSKKKIPPPLLYDLTELQRDGNKKFSYSAQKVLTIAQSLYEKRKMITYPRTDSRYLTNDMKGVVKSTLNKLCINPYGEYINAIKDNIKFTKRIINDSKVSDHHALIPTNITPVLSRLTKEEFNIYNLIVCRFIEIFYPYYIYEITEVDIDVKDEKFLAKGKIVLDKGWTIISREKKDNGQILPNLKINQILNITDVQINKKQTQPPKPYTEADLLTAMEHAGRFVEDEELKDKLKELGLGTPATRAAIIERLLQVGYIIRKGKILFPTDKGKKLIEIVPDQLKIPETTGKWERALNKISKGEMNSEKFMLSIKRYVDFIINFVAESKNEKVFNDDKYRKTKNKKFTSKINFGKCPLCKKGDVLKNSKAYYCSRWNEGCNLTLWINALERYGVNLNDSFIKKLIENGEINNINAILPQTQKKCTVTVFVNDKGNIEIKNLKHKQV